MPYYLSNEIQSDHLEYIAATAAQHMISRRKTSNGPEDLTRLRQLIFEILQQPDTRIVRTEKVGGVNTFVLEGKTADHAGIRCALPPIHIYYLSSAAHPHTDDGGYFDSHSMVQTV